VVEAMSKNEVKEFRLTRKMARNRFNLLRKKEKRSASSMHGLWKSFWATIKDVKKQKGW